MGTMVENTAAILLEELLSLTEPLKEHMTPEDRNDWSDISAQAADLREQLDNRLEFRHLDDNPLAEHIWHFVYLHGKAEEMVACRLGENSSAADLTIANQPMPEFEGDMIVLDCTVYDVPAKCVLSLRSKNFVQGRIALVNDAVGLAHAMSPDQWR